MSIPRKRFGQHFLHDKRTIERIIDAIDPKPGQRLVEIGPGKGALTFPLLKRINHLDVIEIDRDLVELLKSHSELKDKLNIHPVDVLQFDFSELGNDLRLYGNLPYNISTPLIFHLFNYASNIIDMHFMLQKEVVERMAAPCGDKAYGRLSVMVQYHCQIEPLFDVYPDAFFPPPKVDSTVVRLRPYQTLPFPAKNYAQFENLVRQAFSHRRKTLKNSLEGLVNSAQFENARINSQLRPEQLSLADFVNLSCLIGN